jgi:LEA14-like dessication related protein
MKSLWLSVIPVVVACLFLASGCHSSAKLGGVPVSIAQYRPTTLDTQASLTLRFNNENVFPLAIANMAGKLYLNDTYVGHFEIKDAMGVPQLGTAIRDTVLFIENPAYIRQLSTSASAPSIPYRVEIQMNLEVSEEKAKIKAVFTGQIDQAALSAKPVAASKN